MNIFSIQPPNARQWSALTALALTLFISMAVLHPVAYAAADKKADDTMQTRTPEIPGWKEFVQTLETLPATMLGKLPVSMQNDPQTQQEVAFMILEALSVSSVGALGSDGDHPVFLPGIGHFFNVGQPNSDTIYRMTPITPGGSYRLRGNAGSLNISVIGQIGPGPVDLGEDSDHPGATRNYLELSSVKTDSQGNFDILLSPEKPENFAGEWWPLHPKTYRLMLRQVSSDWKNQKDPSIAIERIDIPAERNRPSVEQLETKLRRLPHATAFMATMFVDHVEKLRQQGYTNKLKILDVSQTGGLDGQFYYEGAYDLKDNEALILEAKHPKHCDYRSILLTNEIYQTIDWYNNQSSLNQSQAKTDSDGVLRIVISAQDPSIPNWLDTAGHSKGLIQGRWTNCNSQPIPSVKKVAVKEIRKHLPADTPIITSEQRQQILRERRAAYQLRRHW